MKIVNTIRPGTVTGINHLILTCIAQQVKNYYCHAQLHIWETGGIDNLSHLPTLQHPKPLAPHRTINGTELFAYLMRRWEGPEPTSPQSHLVQARVPLGEGVSKSLQLSGGTLWGWFITQLCFRRAWGLEAAKRDLELGLLGRVCVHYGHKQHHFESKSRPLFSTGFAAGPEPPTTLTCAPSAPTLWVTGNFGCVHLTVLFGIHSVSSDCISCGFRFHLYTDSSQSNYTLDPICSLHTRVSFPTWKSTQKALS